VYKPNFCCECGNKLIRLRWHFWTSRRFCNVCVRRFRRERFVPLLLFSLALISFGYLLARTRRAAPPPLVIEDDQIRRLTIRSLPIMKRQPHQLPGRSQHLLPM